MQPKPTTTRNPWLAPVAILLVLAVAAAMGYSRFAASAKAVELAAEDLTTCRRLLAEIKSLQRLPRFAVLEAESPKTIAERVQEAHQLARLPATALTRIEPQAAQRLGRSPYLIRPTSLELKGLTLAEITEFAHRLGDEDYGLTVRDLRIMEPPGAAGSGLEKWTAEITLTQRVFSPTNR